MSQTNPRIKVLRVNDISSKSDILEYGQPVYDKATKRLLVGDGVTTAKNLKNTSDALSSNAGSSTQPIYFKDGKPVSCETSLGVSVTGSATNVTTSINGKAISSIFENNGTTTKNSTNVTTSINGKAISSIFENNGTRVKNATNSSNVTDTINNLPISSLFDEYGRSTDALEVNGLKIIKGTDNVLKINNLMPTVVIPTKVVLTNTTKLLSMDNDVSLYRPQIVNDIINHKLIFKFLFTMSGGKQNITVFTKPIEINSLKSTSIAGATTSISGIFVETFKVFANIGTEAETSIRIYYNSYSGGIIGKIMSKNSDIEKIEFKELCMMYD